MYVHIKKNPDKTHLSVRRRREDGDWKKWVEEEQKKKTKKSEDEYFPLLSTRLGSTRKRRERCPFTPPQLKSRFDSSSAFTKLSHHHQNHNTTESTMHTSPVKHTTVIFPISTPPMGNFAFFQGQSHHTHHVFSRLKAQPR